jgi:EthD domain
MKWGRMADHWMDGPADLVRNVQDPGYRARMQPHVFFDPSMLIEFTSGYTVYEQPGFTAGGVKLIHFLKKREDIEHSGFAKRWKDQHAPLVLDALQPLGVLRKYVQSPKLALDPGAFKGTFFEMAQFGQYAGIEEFWLSELDDLTRMASDRQNFERIRASAARFVDNEGSFSMVAIERVVYDAVTPGVQSPPPAILDARSLEALIDTQSYGGWHDPRGQLSR